MHERQDYVTRHESSRRNRRVQRPNEDQSDGQSDPSANARGHGISGLLILTHSERDDYANRSCDSCSVLRSASFRSCPALCEGCPLTEDIHRLADAGAKPTFVPGEVIVKMKPSRTIEPAARSRLGVEEAERKTSGGEIIFRIPREAARMMAPTEARERTLAVVQELKGRSDIDYAQPNWIKYGTDKTPPVSR